MDFDQDMLDEFVIESKEHLDSIEDDFLALERQKENPERELVDKVFRAMHSIKGTAGFFGLRNIGELSHVMETLLSMVRESEITPSSEFTDTMLAGVDRLNVLLDDLEHSNEVEIKDVHDRLKELLSSSLSDETKKELETKVELSTADGAEIRLEIDEFTLTRLSETNYLFVLKYDLSESSVKNPIALLRELSQTGEVIDGCLNADIDDLNTDLSQSHLHFEALYDTCLDREMVALSTELPGESIFEIDKKKHATTTSAPSCETELVDVKSETEQRTTDTPVVPTDSPDASTAVPPGRSATLRVNVEILDQLMLLAGELVLVRNQQLMEGEKATGRSQHAVQRLDLVTSELQETIMRTRMQPIGNVFNKFPRVVRDISKKLDKRIELDISGSDVELDKTILENLADPLTHLIRNCCDHGIELPETRERSGKAAAGKVTLKAFHEAGQINIEIEDDGAGINPEAIRKKALQMELKSDVELSAMTEEEIIALVLLPGFSTVEQVTDLSGRGVGMDVVRTSIEKLGGSLDLRSKVGEGTRIQLRLPLTLAIIPCLIIRSGGQRFAIPQVNLDELVCLFDEDTVSKIDSADDWEVYRLRDRLLTMVRLSEVLESPAPFTDKTRADLEETRRLDRNAYIAALSNGQNGGGGGAEPCDRKMNFAVVQARGGRFGLIIDEVIGTEEIVVKPMHPAVKSLRCYSGATVMGDGQVALILDVEGIANHAGVLLDQRSQDEVAEETSAQTQSVLLFKCGEKEQFAMNLSTVRRIERISITDIENIGDKEFITIEGSSVRVLRLENHLSVSPCCGSEEMFLLLPRHCKQSFGILVSSLVDIAEAPLELDTESYVEVGLLGTKILDERMTLFLDVTRLSETESNEEKSRSPKTNGRKQKMTKVLVVEDDSFFRNLVKKYVESLDYEVITADDGKRGLEIFNENEFDLIVSDIEMPFLNGYEFMENVRAGEHHPDIPALALTALDTEQDKLRALESGFDHHEVKIDRESLLKQVVSMVNGAKVAVS